MSGCDCEIEIKDKSESKTLIILLAINALMFIVELIAGLIAQSTALIADSLDMLADATVYGIALYAVGKAANIKTRAASFSGYAQILLACIALVDISRRIIFGSEPEPPFMIIVGCIALVANSICLSIVARHKQGEVHMRASYIFSKVDVLANLGVVTAGILVYFFHTSWPDIIVGLLIVLLVANGARLILQDVKRSRRQEQGCCDD
ncbi:MAG: cation transporter [Gammaproteobacteria bacterium]|nr:cation transporter [Gammaproteobacteria bacterium]